MRLQDWKADAMKYEDIDKAAQKEAEARIAATTKPERTLDNRLNDLHEEVCFKLSEVTEAGGNMVHLDRPDDCADLLGRTIHELDRLRAEVERKDAALRAVCDAWPVCHLTPPDYADVARAAISPKESP